MIASAGRVSRRNFLPSCRFLFLRRVHHKRPYLSERLRQRNIAPFPVLCGNIYSKNKTDVLVDHISFMEQRKTRRCIDQNSINTRKRRLINLNFRSIFRNLETPHGCISTALSLKRKWANYISQRSGKNAETITAKAEKMAWRIGGVNFEGVEMWWPKPMGPSTMSPQTRPPVNLVNLNSLCSTWNRAIYRAGIFSACKLLLFLRLFFTKTELDLPISGIFHFLPDTILRLCNSSVGRVKRTNSYLIKSWKLNANEERKKHSQTSSSLKPHCLTIQILRKTQKHLISKTAFAVFGF